MIAVAFLAQNCAMGMAIGMFGSIVEAIQHQFSTSRALASAGLSMMIVTMGLVSPLVGVLMQRMQLKTIMIFGAMICAIGYSLLAMAPNIYALLGIYALVIGPGVCMLGVIPSSALVANWFEYGRGRALGFVNMPFFTFVFPFIAATIVQAGGTQAVFLTAAAIYVALIPVLTLVVARPEDVGERPFGTEIPPTPSLGPASAVSATASTLTTSQLLRNPAFLILVLGSLILTGAGFVLTAHIVSIALDRGIELKAASLLLSAVGLAGAAGALIFGWVADRFGPAKAYGAVCLLQIPAWGFLMITNDYTLLLLVAASIGICAGSAIGLLGTAMSAWLGHANFGRAMGLIYLLKVPMLFSAAPLAGYAYDVTGSYNVAIVTVMVALGAMGLIFLLFKPSSSPNSTTGRRRS